MPGDLPTKPASPVSEQSRLVALIIEGNILTVMGLFLGLGLLLAFTPCVLPMVPILSGIIAGQGKDITTLRAFLLSLTYVLGMALTYTLAGILFAAAGQQVQALLQQAWIIIAVSLLFSVLALAMFGFFTLQLPAFLQTRINSFSRQQKAGTFIGTAIMGALSALVVTTCVAPPLVATLTVIAESGDVYRGGAALFALSMGMGFPLLVIGTSAGRLLPKAGAWMVTIKELFGFMMLGLAIWMLERLLPGGITMVLWALLLLSMAVRLWMLSTGFKFIVAALSKILAVLLAGYGLITLYAAYQGGTNPLNSVASINGTQQHLTFIRVKTIADLDTELANAKATGQYVMFDFYADWCVSCKEMEYYTFTDPAVQEALANTRLLQADVTANDDADQALLQRMGIFGPPTIVFFDSNGEEIEEKRVIGFQSAEVFREHLRSVFQ
jgi:thiol:disulfide interchange protein DsbD